jgi:hypothetical protein
MNDLQTVGDFIWWIKRTVSNAVLISRSPRTIQDIYEKAQLEVNASLRTVMGDLEPMDERQLEVLKGFIYRTVQRRENVRAEKKDAKEDLDAQDRDDKELKDALLPDYMELI